MPKISIVVPVYKTENYLRKCIESVINQVYNDWELILVDDGSPDNSGIICDEYAQKDERIKVIHKQNAGVGAARNTGLEAVIGEYVVFIDSDDFCDKDYLTNFEIELENQSDLVIQGYKKYINNIHKGKEFNERIYDKYELVNALLDNKLLSFGAPYCKLFKREILEKYHIRFSTDYSYGEDTYFFFNYCTHILSLKLVSGTGYFYRCEQEGSLSVKNHDFLNLVTFANDSLQLLRKIDVENRLEIAYSYSYVRIYARALINMYRLEYPKNKRIYYISSINKHIKPKVKIFRGISSLKLVYLMALKMPPFIVDFILFIYYKLNH